MLSNKELSYANVSTDIAPFPGVDYAEQSVDNLIKAYENYVHDYQDKEYDIIMSDGNDITLQIMNKNICHMLGIDYKHIIDLIKNDTTGLPFLNQDQLNSYAVLNYIVEHIEDVVKHDKNSRIRFLNYFKIMIKSTIFMSFSNFKAFDFGVVKFDKKRYDETKYKRFSASSTTLLFTPSNELVVPYYVMGLKQAEEGDNLIVETMYAHANVSEFIDGQELVLPTQILITDKKNQELSKQCATAQEKYNLLMMYQNIIHKAGIQANINIFGDYESLLIEEIHKQKTL